MSNRDLLVVVRNQSNSAGSIERELRNLDRILVGAETLERFCVAHELVDRNRITRKKIKLIRESSYARLRPFRFLINRN